MSRYENGENKLSASQLYFLSQSLGVPIAEITGFFFGIANSPLTTQRWRRP
ncbi:helix-turn-helix transcriptional regulator [Cellvibrio sp. BR]|uniref:helix-turn-helix transcriptional regulator n=1 Tax=Cellvibrio sp. BR TaxID=1134474 RepID=UPI0009D9B757